MEDRDKIFILSLINGILAILVGIVLFIFPITLGVAAMVTAIIMGVLVIVSGLIAKAGRYSIAWILLLIFGVLTIPIGFLGVWAAILAFKLRKGI